VRRQVKQRLGPAWLERTPVGDSWRARPGQPAEGFLDERQARAAIEAAIVAYEQELASLSGRSSCSFETAAADWRRHQEHVAGAKPSTLADYDYLLTPPGTPARKQGRRRGDGRVMREFGGQELHTISADQIERWLEQLADLGLSRRTVNKHRQLLCSVLGFAARRPDRYGIVENVAATVPVRREPDRCALKFYEPSEIQMLADAARMGACWSPRRPARSLTKRRIRRAANQRDAALYVLAACAGLRAGELRALRWGDVSFSRATVTVSRSWSTDELTSPKSRRPRTVPLATRPAVELQTLRRHSKHTEPADYVFCEPDGRPLSPTGMRKRFLRTRAAAGLRPLRFHDLRHTFGSIAVREVDTATLKAWMGHARLVTTEQYIHAKPRHDDAARLDRVFGTGTPPAPEPRT
jgi:integrase